MMDETIFLGGCPVIQPEGIYLNGRRVIRLGLQAPVGVGDVGDLLAYRQEWDSFIHAHLELWRTMNGYLEGVPEAQQCPPGVFDPSKINGLSDTMRSLCASIRLTRARTSDTDPGGIRQQWNAWANKSSTEIVAGAKPMLEWHQEVVMRVGGQFKDELLQLAKNWKIAIELPDLPSFSTQQEIIARIEGAYITAKGVIQIVGYGVGEVLEMAGDVTKAVAQGLTDTAKELPKTTRWIGIAAAVAVVVVGGGLIIYYLPRRTPPPSPRLPAPG